jgi:hypothetical protein
MSKGFDAWQRLESEDRIPLKRAIPLFENEPSLRTLRRYVSHGLLCRYLNKKIFLEAYRASGTWMTSRQAVRRFIARINGGE